VSEWWVATDLIIASNSPVSLLFGISPAVSLPSTRRCALPTSVFDNDLQNLPNCIFSVSFYANTDIRWKHEFVLETLQKHSCAILSISRFSWDPIYRLAICKPGSTDSNINFTCYQGLIQPVSLGGGDFSDIWHSSLITGSLLHKRDEVYFTTLLWQNNGRPNGLISWVLFSELHKVMVNKVTSVGLGGKSPQSPSPPGSVPACYQSRACNSRKIFLSLDEHLLCLYNRSCEDVPNVATCKETFNLYYYETDRDEATTTFPPWREDAYIKVRVNKRTMGDVRLIRKLVVGMGVGRIFSREELIVDFRRV